jgi:hypothetical protein
VEHFRGEPGVHQIELNVKPGGRIKSPLRSEDRVGFVMAQAGSAAEAASLCRRVVDGVQFNITPE